MPAKKTEPEKEVLETEEKTQSTVQKEGYDIITPRPYTFVAYDDGSDFWADKNGVIYTDDEKVRDWLLTFAEFKEVPKER